MFPSTTYHWNPAKVRPPRRVPYVAAGVAVRYLPLVRRNWFKPLDMKMAYIGGATGEVRITTRGATWVVPGGLSTIEMLQWVNGRATECKD
jgi:hypothetical protein